MLEILYLGRIPSITLGVKDIVDVAESLFPILKYEALAFEDPPISVKNVLYFSRLKSSSLWSICQLSIWDWISSLFCNKALFLGENSLTIFSKEDQKCSFVISKPTRTSFSRKSFKYDETVRNTANTVVQFKYGEDSTDPTRSKFGSAVDIDSLIEEITGGK